MSLTKAELEADMDRFQAESEEASRRATKLMAADPKLPYISAYIMARDLMGAERSLQWLREGKSWEEVEMWAGSYGRLDLRYKAWHEGLITDAQACEGLAGMWSYSDPDDTDPRFLSLWLMAYARNGYKPLREGPRKRLPNGQRLTIYRGQDEGVPFGLSWSLDYQVAVKFANGAATRQHKRGGAVYAATVDRRNIMGYMTGRGESEVIVNPDDIGADAVVLWP